jgi:hypothetical protein
MHWMTYTFPHPTPEENKKVDRMSVDLLFLLWWAEQGLNL